MDLAKNDKRVFELAESFLTGLTTKDGKPVTKKMVDKYFRVDTANTLAEVYFRLLVSAQNANMKAGVIGGSIDGIENLRSVLFNFEPHAIVQKYGSNSQKVFSDIKNTSNRAARSIQTVYGEDIVKPLFQAQDFWSSSARAMISINGQIVFTKMNAPARHYHCYSKKRLRLWSCFGLRFSKRDRIFGIWQTRRMGKKNFHLDWVMLTESRRQ